MKSSRFFVMYLVASDKKASTICTITHCACMTKGNLLSRFSQLLCVEKRMEKASLSLSLSLSVTCKVRMQFQNFTSLICRGRLRPSKCGFVRHAIINT